MLMNKNLLKIRDGKQRSLPVNNLKIITGFLRVFNKKAPEKSSEALFLSNQAVYRITMHPVNELHPISVTTAVSSLLT